eukprot:comp21606_c0_seq1/m.30278 comp21606_c0_seq1/g.30278  ORF comp21606_c0_seq1/g.30278 comp21606_c0_seq1/m.30278 type:complete len:454 (-) comp21606_c0_seq1:584-1945(-)
MAKLNYNVSLSLGLTFIDGIAQGIWGFALLGPYLYALCGDNSHAGYAEGIQGFMQALAAIPAGFLADKIRRDTVLRGSSALGLVAIVLMLYALFWGGDSTHTFILMTVGLGMWGFFTGAYLPPLQSIFADSVPNGNRSNLETWRYVSQIFATAAGPATNVALFYYLGDHWDLSKMSIVFAVGVCLNAVSTFGLIFLSDNKTLGHESEALVQGQEASEDNKVSTESAGRWSIPESWVPFVCCTSDIISGLASGMTIKFFPVFFALELQLSPIPVNTIYCMGPVCMALFSLLAQRASRRVGRVQAVLTTNSVGIMLMAAMAMLRPVWRTQQVVVVIVYVIRTACMNCTYPLMRSILMDYVTKENRGKWNSLESISSFGWSGSAALGGVLVDRVGFGHTFYFTALVQFVALVPVFLLLPVVPIEKSSQKSDLVSDEAKPLVGGVGKEELYGTTETL